MAEWLNVMPWRGLSIEADVTRAAVGNPLKAISLSADEIAVQAHASQSAVNRFATHAGFSSMAELRAALTAELQDVQEPIAKLQRSGDLSSEHPFADAQSCLLQALDSIAGCSNTPDLVSDLRERGLGKKHLPCERIEAIDRDGKVCRPGVYSLTEQGRRMVHAWMASRPKPGAEGC